ncbi:hypothetical protein G1C96_1910 [Bifidobacterium sp. DSM 109958]|uniref:Uncharacterized protein n=1 Tax=Bifidobacterium moraviense TaxID=2675323 RepID=A0A7Y0F3E9_9BIFI|nr:hypothetical protein [Bifidobacterium sp. DSM 109958]NMN01321.1 hypothetical protein [Bifidobacterium sp. DSM 109958]
MNAPTLAISPFPKLFMRHTPGFRFDVQRDGGSDGRVMTVFDSEMPAFNLGFALDVFGDGEVSNSVSPESCELAYDMTPDELADLASKTDALQTWLDDCATVTQWVTDNARQLAAMMAGH